MEKVYKLSQIIFALRQEYQKVQKELETLKKYVVSTDTLDDYYFNLEGNPTRMLLYLETKQRRLEKLFGRDCMVCKDITENVDKNYIRHGKPLCQISDPVELSTEIEKFIYSDFVHNMRNMRAFQHCLEEQKDVICIEPDKIRLWTLPDETKSEHFMEYNAHADQLVVRSGKKMTKPIDVMHLLQLSFDGTKLNEFQQAMIDQYIRRDLFLEDVVAEDQLVLGIEDNSKKIVLTPKHR